jgi:hypothetical protein
MRALATAMHKKRPLNDATDLLSPFSLAEPR